MIEPINEMSDLQLINICAQKLTKRTLSPWLYWTSELYSLGKTYRIKYGFSKYFPLIFYSDHGVGLEDYFDDHEISNKARYHLTFSQYKYEKLRYFEDKKVVLVEHPFLHYRKIMDLKLNPERKGTICFLPHSVPGTETIFDINLELYLSALNKLDDKFKPFVFCLHMHDVIPENLEKIRQLNVPIISNGNTLNSDYVDNFYKNISNFQFATSPDLGTHTFLCEDFGVKFFLFGKSNTQGIFRERYNNYRELEKIFSLDNIGNSKIKSKYLDLFLGRNSSKYSEWKYPRLEYYSDLIKLSPNLIQLYIYSLTHLCSIYARRLIKVVCNIL
jgi:hypothetical protein